MATHREVTTGLRIGEKKTPTHHGETAAKKGGHKKNRIVSAGVRGGSLNRFSGLSLMAGILLGATWGCSKPPAVAAPPVVPVRVSTVDHIPVGKTARYSASIVPNEQIDLLFKSGGYVASIRQVRGADGRMRPTDVGDHVKAGTVLAAVRAVEYEDHIKQAQADLARALAAQEQAKLNFDRTSTLFGNGSATKPEYDQAKAQFDSTTASVEAARAQVSIAHTHLTDSILKAPRDGWIVKRNIDVGSLVGPSNPAFSLIDTHLVRVSFGVPDTAIRLVNLGKKLRVTTEAAGDFEGRVTSVSPSADPRSRVYSVEITLANPADRLKAGMIAALTLEELQSRELAAIPLAAVLRSPQNANTFIAMVPEAAGNGYVARPRVIQLGDVYGNNIAVAAGLQPGEQVITTGASLVHDGDRLQVMP